jgi:hypothetical protein
MHSQTDSRIEVDDPCLHLMFCSRSVTNNLGVGQHRSSGSGAGLAMQDFIRDSEDTGFTPNVSKPELGMTGTCRFQK